jgi:hypothetical protein
MVRKIIIQFLRKPFCIDIIKINLTLRRLIVLDAKYIKFYEFGSPKDVLKIEYKTIEPPKKK